MVGAGVRQPFAVPNLLQIGNEFFDWGEKWLRARMSFSCDRLINQDVLTQHLLNGLSGVEHHDIQN